MCGGLLDLVMAGAGHHLLGQALGHHHLVQLIPGNTFNFVTQCCEFVLDRRQKDIISCSGFPGFGFHIGSTGAVPISALTKNSTLKGLQSIFNKIVVVVLLPVPALILESRYR